MIIIPVLLEQCDFESRELCPKTVDCSGGLVQLSLRALEGLIHDGVGGMFDWKPY